MGKGKQMAEYLCETCKHRKGDLKPYNTYEWHGTECSYTAAKHVNCTASKKHPGMVKAAPKRPAWMEPTSVCPSYRKREK